MSKYQDLINLISSAEGDATKFYEKSVAKAGTRLRKVMQEVKKLAQEIRNEVSEKKNAEKEA